MKKILFVLFITGVGFTSCNKEAPVPLTKAEIKQKIDSIMAVRMKQSDEMARIDLERRMKIEVKVKVDSIVNAQLQPGKKDSAKANSSIQVSNLPTGRQVPNAQGAKPKIPGFIPTPPKK